MLKPKRVKKQKMKAECKEGPDARRHFENTMKGLFRVPKSEATTVQKGKD